MALYVYVQKNIYLRVVFVIFFFSNFALHTLPRKKEREPKKSNSKRDIGGDIYGKRHLQMFQTFDRSDG